MVSPKFFDRSEIYKISTVLVAGLVASLALAACSEDDGKASQAKAPPPSVTVAPVTKSIIDPSFEIVGQTKAVASVQLRARVKGFLESRGFKEGDDVEKDAVLFTIERDNYEANVDIAKAKVGEAKAELIRAEKDLERFESLVSRGNISQQKVDLGKADKLKAEAQVKSAEADLRQAELDLSYTEIKAPFAGRIGQESFSVGNLVGPDSGVLATLVDLDPIYVNFNVSERDYLTYQQREMAARERGEPDVDVLPNFRLANGKGYDHIGKLDFVDNEVDPATGTIRVRAIVDNPDKLLLPGQFITVVLRSSERVMGLLIPQAAVQEDQAGRFVLVVNKEKKVEMRRVDLGERFGIFWQVEDGLAEGEQVIYQGIQKVRPGGTVEPVVNQPMSPAAEQG